MEEWQNLAHVEFGDYSVSNRGRVRNDRSGLILSQSLTKVGASKVGLIHDYTTRQQTVGVALLVANEFLPGKSENLNTPINLNGDRSDNDVDNLAWRPRWFAIQYHKQFFSDLYMHNTLPFYIMETEEVFDNVRQIAMKYGMLEKHIIHDITNQDGTWPHGFHFQVLENQTV